jgi:hypothetical protein
VARLTKRSDIPESAFAFPDERKEPLTDASHVRNAIARFDQTEGVSDAERDRAFAKIKRAAKKYGVEMTETHWSELGKKPSGASRKKTASGRKKTASAAKKSTAKKSTRKKTATGRKKTTGAAKKSTSKKTTRKKTARKRS